MRALLALSFQARNEQGYRLPMVLLFVMANRIAYVNKITQ